MNLYEISQHYLKLLDQEEYSVQDMTLLEEMNDNFRDKAIAVAAFIQNTKSEILAIEMAIEKMEKRSENKMIRVHYLTDYLKRMMFKTGINEIVDHPEFQIKIKTNPSKVDVYDIKLVPSEYLSVKTSVLPDKKLIKEALNNQKIVPGAKIVQDSHLEIK